ncbi:O-antigen ligase family protein [Clavibacter michiganensis]|uniref:O-antigen ligase family protein n=1 Tax=Clavibacter michiganensis TaxID=28447 RepID=UPI0011B05DC7|nr:hypothetical protein [Clavibacter michiganensis]
MAAFGVPGAVRVLGLTETEAVVLDDLSVFLRFAPMLALGIAIGVSNIFHGHLYGSHLLLLLVVTIPIAYVIDGFSLMPIVAGLAFLPALAASKGRVPVELLVAGLGHSLKLISVPLILFGITGSVLGTCRMDKCSVWGQQLGTMGAGNALGLLVAVLAFAGVYTARSNFWAVANLIGTLLLVDLSSSRSGLVVWVFAVGAGALLRLTESVALTVRIRLMAAALTVAVAGAVAVAVTPWSPSAFTLRGILWLRAQDLIADNVLLGVGSSFWVRQPYTTAMRPNYATHNIVLESMLSFGLLGTVALVLALIAAILRADLQSRLIGLAIAVIWVAGGIAEVPSAPGRLYLVPGLLPLLFVILNNPRAAKVTMHLPQSAATSSDSQFRRGSLASTGKLALRGQGGTPEVTQWSKR